MSVKSKSKKDKRIDFSDMSARDFAALLFNTAVTGRDSGHNVLINNARVNDRPSLVIVLSGWRYDPARSVIYKEDGDGSAI